MLKEIGSDFWINPSNYCNDSHSQFDTALFGCIGTDCAWFSTGRSATSFVLDTIEIRNPKINKVAILPPFTCHTVIEPFIRRGYDVQTYHVGRELTTTANDILQSAISSQAGVLLFHRFFGVDTIKDIDVILPKLREMGVVVIEDCTQCLYSDFKKSDADYWVGSIRKWCGVPDGGFAVCKDGCFVETPTEIDIKLQDLKRIASTLKYEYMFENKGEKSMFYSQYRKADEMIDAQDRYYTISDLSRTIQSNLNIEELKSKRRANYEIIARGLKDFNEIHLLFESMNEDEVPLYCPILCEDRRSLQNKLVKNSIYAPIVWPKAECCPKVDEESNYVYEHILCIPIDQRYDSDDMERVLDVIKNND